MPRQDIVAGLKNALERGEPITKAKQSLINAGYSLNEVNEAANYLTGGAVEVNIPKTPQPKPTPPPQTQPAQEPQTQTPPQTQTQPAQEPQTQTPP
ncbi:MAG: hypothetical protein U9Q06_04865, partial [Nanoarchaeota archaeon]|nr:hypothetical protein [Nanoarchaeota archaeon]